MTLAEPVTDRMRSNSGDATTLVVDIEFGHNVLGSRYRHQKAEVARSASIAEELVTALTTCAEIKTVTSVLVDDKHEGQLSCLDRHVDEIEKLVAPMGMDRIMLESELSRNLPELLALVPSRKRESLERDIADWRARHNGFLACSQDIAIWHTLRLGLIADMGVTWARDCDDVGNPDTQRVCVSVLPERFRPFEDRSYAEILRHIPSFPGDFLHHVYFELDDTLDELRRRLDTVVRQIKRLAALNRPFMCPTGSMASYAIGPVKPPLLDGIPIKVIGSGVVGLSTAIKLRQAGADVTVVSSDRSPMASAAACALWLPLWVCSTRNLLGKRDEHVPLAEESWHHYRQLLDEMGDQIGMRSIVNHEYLERGTENPPDWLCRLSPLSEFEDCELEWHKQTYDRIWKFESFVIDMSRYMLWLRWWAEAVGVTFRFEHVRDLESAWDGGFRAVVNCSGLGARKLANDRSVVPVRGQLVFYENESLDARSCQVSVGLGEHCLIPRIDDVGIGSLLIEEDDDVVHPTYSAEDERKLRQLVEPLRALSGIDGVLDFSGRVAVGLRPMRVDGFRLDAKRKSKGVVVHNYGHGGAGVTLAWGCAAEVVRRAVDALGVGPEGREWRPALPALVQN
jgi:D-amino-acid oxidase